MSAALIVLALLPLAGALLAALARGRLAVAGAAAVLATTFVLAAWLLLETSAGGTTVVSRSWAPALDLTLALRFDRLSGATALLIALAGLAGLGGLWRLTKSAAREPVAGSDSALLVLFAGLTQALVLTENLLVLVAFAELGALVAFALERGRGAGEGPARAALYVRSGSALLLLAAALVLADTAGSFEFGSVFAAGASIRAHALYPLLLALVLAAAWSRAAAWPWIRWPRGADLGDDAAAGVTGACLLATGVYLAIRLSPLVVGALPRAVVAIGFVALPLLVAVLGRAARALGAREEAPASRTPAAVARARE